MTSERPEADEDLTIRDLELSVLEEVFGVDLIRGEGGSGWRDGLVGQGREAGPDKESSCTPRKKLTASASSREIENLGSCPDSPLPLLLLASWGLELSLLDSVVEKEEEAVSPMLEGMRNPAPATIASNSGQDLALAALKWASVSWGLLNSGLVSACPPGSNPPLSALPMGWRGAVRLRLPIEPSIDTSELSHRDTLCRNCREAGSLECTFLYLGEQDEKDLKSGASSKLSSAEDPRVSVSVSAS